MRQSWMDQRLQYEHIKEQKKIPEGKFFSLSDKDPGSQNNGEKC